MDLLQVYDDMLHQYCSNLKAGDVVWVDVMPDSFLASRGVMSGCYRVLSYHKGGRPCSIKCCNDYHCVYIACGPRGSEYCTCGSHLYNKDGNRFNDDFDYYKEFPKYVGNGK